MAELFNIVGEGFFKPLTSQFRSVYLKCLYIIYDAYRSELSYGAEREVVISRLVDYFDSIGLADVQFEDDLETYSDSRSKASGFVRKLKEYGWIEYEQNNNRTIFIIMPNYAVTLLQSFEEISRDREMEYQGEISAIYSMLSNEELFDRPYSQVLKPVYERTLALFTGLKKLNTSIRKYIDKLTMNKSPEDIFHDFFEYQDEIGSKAYHRIKTSDNISRFRNVIVSRMRMLHESLEWYQKAVEGYVVIEECADIADAHEGVNEMIDSVISHFYSYDALVEEIEAKHRKYIKAAVERAKFLLVSSNNIEGKISKVLQLISDGFNRDEEADLCEDADDDICRLFNVFPQSFISGESLKAIPVSKRLSEIEEIFSPMGISQEERERRRLVISERNKNRFSKKNICAYTMSFLGERTSALASEIPINSKRDLIRIIFIALYARAASVPYRVVPSESLIERDGFRFRDFTISRR